MQEQQANALFEQSVALLQQGKAQEALKILAKLDQAIPSNPGILYFTATGHSIAGNKHKAIQTYERVLRLNPQFIEAYNNIALDLAYIGDHQQAISIIDKALKIQPNFIEAMNNKACFLNAIGDYELAKISLLDALAFKPNDPTTLANLSGTLIRLQEIEAATMYANQLISLNPLDHRGHNNLGKICLVLEQYNQALEHFQRAHTLNPQDIDNLADLGNAHDELGDSTLAILFLNQAKSLSPNHGTTFLNLGLHYLYQRKFDKANEYLSAPLQDKNRLTLREYNRALCHLHAGALEMGWVDYAWRWKEAGIPVPYLLTATPLWEGQTTNEPVFIWHEQGVGDQILFGTLLTEAAQVAPNLVVRLDKRLIPIFERSFSNTRFISQDHLITNNDFKYHLPIGDLARLFRPALQDFDRQATSYLIQDSDHVKQLRNTQENGKPIVGLAWVTKGKRSKERNLPIDEIVSIIQSVTPSELIDLQYSDTTEDRARISQKLGAEIRHLNQIDNFNDLDGLSSLISACDFVITCSNSTAHLAGALGKETYLLVPFGRGRHWYWSHIGDDGRSLWYPSVQVIPQTIPGDWAEPMQVLKDRLSSRPKLG